MNKSLTLKIVLCLIICLLVGYIGSMATETSIDSWYVGLKKPSWTPPSWVFGPVWTVIYVLMAVATALVWQRGTHHNWVSTSLSYFGLQLLLNGLWSVTFFGYENPFLALVVIVALFITLIFTMRWYRIAYMWSAVLLIPYILWVAFALALNFSIWRLN